MAFSLARYRVEVQGETPLLMNNGDVACNNLNPIVKLKKTITGKRKKTDDDIASISIIEWYLGLYLDAPHSVFTDSEGKNVDTLNFNGGLVTVIPGKLFKSAICQAGTTFKLGSTLKPNLRVSFNCPFQFGDDPDPNVLVNKNKYFDNRPVVVNRARIMKARPVFPTWSASFDVQFFTDKLELNQVKDCIELAGQIVGIGDYRPAKNGDFGTFKIVKMEEI